MTEDFEVKGVLCSGAIIQDTLVRPVDNDCWGTTTFVDTIEPHIGGNGANTSLALAKLGIPVRLLGAAGRDACGDELLSRLTSAGVDTACIHRTHAPTAATIAIVNSAGDRRFLHRLGASAEAFQVPIDFRPELIQDSTHYHLASLFILPNLRKQAAVTLARARAAGLTTSFDTNWDPLGRWMEDVGPCLHHLDFVFMNEDEARMVTGTSDPFAGARILREKGARVAVMKLGRAGCAIYSAEGEVRCPAFEVEVVDTTGAGDCFVAGFLSTLLRGLSLSEAGRFANAVGALSVQKVGAAAGVLNYDETLAWMMR